MSPKLIKNYKAKAGVYTTFILLLIASLSAVFFIAPNNMIVKAGSGDFVAWDYYIVCPISNAINNYTMSINITKTSGGDVGCDGGCQDDFGDIRFADADDNTSLDYYLEYFVSGSYANFWVELPTDASSDNKIILWYGTDVTSSTTSNGNATFIFFDDFEEGSLNSSKWGVTKQSPEVSNDQAYNGTYSLKLLDGASDEQVRGNITFPDEFVYHCEYYRTTGVSRTFFCLRDNEDALLYTLMDKDDKQMYYDGEFTDYSNSQGWTVDAWHTIDQYVDYSATNLSTYVEGVHVGYGTNGVFSGTSAGKIHFQASDSNANAIYIDNVWIRLYTDGTPPSWGSFGGAGGGTIGSLTFEGSSNSYFTTSGILPGSYYANNTGAYHETANLTVIIDNVNIEYIRINVSDIDTNITANYINISFDDDNSSWSGNWHGCTDGGESIILNNTTWAANNWMSGTNPFTADGDADGHKEIQANTSIYFRVRVSYPSGIGTETYSKLDMTYDGGKYE